MEDDPDFAAFVEKAASRHGPSDARTDRSTLLERCLASGEPDVMTLDMEMPLRSGL
jgi:DNA-binding response OmpR family regulator